MTVLRVYDPAECDSEGVPLDWERCRACGGTGEIKHATPGYAHDYTSPVSGPVIEPFFRPCEACGGHGSLKAAALAASRRAQVFGTEPRRFHEGLEHWQAHKHDPLRCTGCSHPASEGAWEPEGSSELLRWALVHLPQAEPPGPVFWSPCDERCDHGAVLRWRDPESARRGRSWLPGQRDVTAADYLVGEQLVEASWRHVDVRTLGWPHDLRVERLAVLCTRCWAGQVNR